MSSHTTDHTGEHTAASKNKRKPANPQPALPLDHLHAERPHTKAEQASMREYSAATHRRQQPPPAAPRTDQPVQLHYTPAHLVFKHSSEAMHPGPPQPAQPQPAVSMPGTVQSSKQQEACCCAMSLLVFSTGEWCVAARRCDARGVTIVEHWLTGLRHMHCAHMKCIVHANTLYLQMCCIVECRPSTASARPSRCTSANGTRRPR